MMVLPPVPLCDKFLSAVDYLVFLIPVYPYNSLPQIALVAIHTRNLEKRFRLHPAKEASIFIFYFLAPLRCKGKHCFPLPLSPVFSDNMFDSSGNILLKLLQVQARLLCFVLVQADKSEGSPWAPWQGGKSQGSDSVWCCFSLLCTVQVVMSHLARVERRSKLGRSKELQL